jgi:hypothetical protein
MVYGQFGGTFVLLLLKISENVTGHRRAMIVIVVVRTPVGTGITAEIVARPDARIIPPAMPAPVPRRYS